MRPTLIARNVAAARAGRSPGKHKAILDAATEIFLRNGFLGTSMDEVALQSAVSKQTVYQHFASKEALSVEIVTTMTDAAGDAVLYAAPVLPDGGDVSDYLQTYAPRQLTACSRRALMQLRRLGDR